MAEEHIGSLVLIDCGPALGTYQGRIASVDPSSQTITLEQPLRNGVPFQVPKVTLKSQDITDLKILQLADEFERTVNTFLTSCRSGAKISEMNGTNDDFPKLESTHDRHGNGHHPSDHGDQKQNTSNSKTKVSAKLQQIHMSPGDLIHGNDDRNKPAKSASPCAQRPRSRPIADHQPYDHAYKKDDGIRRPQPYDPNCSTIRRPLSDLCAPLDFDLMSTDFDFESNLAMFEKLPSHPEKASAASNSSAKQTAALDRLFHSLDHTSATTAGSPTKSRNVRHDENVVHDPSRVYVNAKRTWRYLTDDGAEVHALTAAQKRELYERALRKGYTTQDGLTYAMANSAAQLSTQLLREKNITTESVSFYMIFSGVDHVSKQIAKHLSRFVVNRGHSVTWILTGAAGQQESEAGVKIVTAPINLPSTASRSLAFVIGRQGHLADEVSTWLLKNTFCACVFVESDWRGVESTIPDEDLLTRLGLEGGALTRIPSRLLLCWQLPCEEADADLKSPVYVCDINLPSHFIEHELPTLAASAKEAIRQKSKPYKFPFGQGNLVKLRKL